jgi:uncharacterized integral membrane protein
MKGSEIAKRILLVVIGIATLVFFIQNAGIVTIRFLKLELINIPLFLALLIFYILGAISGGLLFSLVKSLKSREKKSGNEETSHQA